MSAGGTPTCRPSEYRGSMESRGRVGSVGSGSLSGALEVHLHLRREETPGLPGPPVPVHQEERVLLGRQSTVPLVHGLRTLDGPRISGRPVLSVVVPGGTGPWVPC